MTCQSCYVRAIIVMKTKKKHKHACDDRRMLEHATTHNFMTLSLTLCLRLTI